jgi:hypothetical protein
MATMTSAISLRATSPLRPVDWRFRAAADRVKRGLALPRRDWDSLTLSTALYLSRVLRGEDPRRLAAEFPDLHAALEIYRDVERGPRWGVEAWLMTGIPAADVAAKFGIAPAAIECFEVVCFDFRDRLECIDLVVRRLINRPVAELHDYRDLGWKRVAYYGGAKALSQLFGVEQENGFREIVRSNCSATKLAAALRLRRLVETICLEPSGLRDVSKVVGYLGDATEDKGDEYCDQVEQLVFGIESGVLSRRDIESNPDLQRGIEPRAHEVLLAALGLPTPYDEIKGLTFDEIVAGRESELANRSGYDQDAVAE